MLRPSPLVLALVLALWVTITASASSGSILELNKGNLTVAMHHWKYDLAVMFYAPWCPNCKQFDPYWDEIYLNLQSRSNLQLSRFNCELPQSDHLDFCQDLGVDSYPSLYFIGYGDFYQSGSYKSNIVKFNADIYPDAILVWLRMLNTFSGYQQKWDVFRSLLPFSSHETLLMKQNLALMDEVGSLRRDVQSTRRKEDLDRIRSEYVEDSADRGDVFALLSSLDANSEKTYPLRLCVADYSLEYCRMEGSVKEDYCVIIAECAQDNMKSERCRPSSCPFDDKLGCTLTSNCLDVDVIELFKAAILAESSAASP